MRLTRMKAIVFSAVIALLSVSLLVLGTFALFSDSSESNVHLQAASLEARLYRTSLSGNRLGEDGTLKPFEESRRVDLEKEDSAIFSLENVVPGVEQTAVLSIENHGGVAFDYSVSVVNVAAESAADKALAQQLKITVSPAEGEPEVFYLNEYEEKGQNLKLGTLAADESVTKAEFSVKVEFVSGETIDNSAMNGKAVFDLRVDAVQSAAQ